MIVLKIKKGTDLEKEVQEKYNEIQIKDKRARQLLKEFCGVEPKSFYTRYFEERIKLPILEDIEFEKELDCPKLMRYKPNQKICNKHSYYYDVVRKYKEGKQFIKKFYEELNYTDMSFVEKYGIPFEYGEDNRFWCSAFPYLNGDYYYLTFSSNNVFDYIKVTPNSPFTMETI
jgi:hypothetical protein